MDVRMFCQWPFNLTSANTSYKKHNPSKKETYVWRSKPTVYIAQEYLYLTTSLYLLIAQFSYLPVNCPSSFTWRRQIWLILNPALALLTTNLISKLYFFVHTSLELASLCPACPDPASREAMWSWSCSSNLPLCNKPSEVHGRWEQWNLLVTNSERAQEEQVRVSESRKAQG